MTVSIPDEIAAVFDSFPVRERQVLVAIRTAIFDIAARTNGVGRIVETLKWGQPSYETVGPRSGSPVRLGLVKTGRPAVFCHCQTTLIAEFRDQFPDEFEFEGNRALVLKSGVAEVADPLAICIARALTYRLR